MIPHPGNISLTNHPMKPALRIIFLTLALAGLAAAATPSRPILTKYQGLWNNSPFTSKPPPPEAGPAVDPLEDFALLGVSPIAGGYRVTMINTKKPDERVTVDSDKPSGDYKILSVIRKSGDPLGTTVRMTAGSITGTVGFDEKQLTLAPPPAAAPPQPGAQPQLGQVPQPQLQPGQAPPRQPRPRVVPPPAPGAQPQQQQQSNQRPERRR